MDIRCRTRIIEIGLHVMCRAELRSLIDSRCSARIIERSQMWSYSHQKMSCVELNYDHQNMLDVRLGSSKDDIGRAELIERCEMWSKNHRNMTCVELNERSLKDARCESKIIEI